METKAKVILVQKHAVSSSCCIFGGDDVRVLVVAIVATMVAVSAADVTVHRSFRGGFPTVVSEARRNAVEKGTSAGATRDSPRTAVVVGKSIVGTVTRVSDGDTIWVTDSAGKHKIRLDKIDAPESDQAFGKEAAQFLKDLVYGEEVEVRWAEESPVNPYQWRKSKRTM